MFLITADLHGNIKKLNGFIRKAEYENCKYIIICGDFGFIWDKESLEVFNKVCEKGLKDTGIKILFVDGNHENFDLLNKMPIDYWNGGLIGKVNEYCYHLTRGQVFTIEGKTFFTMGGAHSYDKSRRTEGVSWWSQENIGTADMLDALKKLDRYDWEVDYVLTHTIPTTILMKYKERFCNPTTNENILDYFYHKLVFERWFAGHWHTDTSILDVQIHYLTYSALRGE